MNDRTTEAVYLGNHLRISASGFVYKLSNLISQATDPVDGLLIFQNAGKVRARGVEFELETKMHHRIEALASYTFESVENESGSPLTNSPRHLGKLRLTFPVLPKLAFLSADSHYVGSRLTLSGEKAAGYAVANLTLLASETWKGIGVSFNIYNVFDKRFVDPAAEEFRQDGIQQDGRSFRLKLTYRINASAARRSRIKISSKLMQLSRTPTT